MCEPAFNVLASTQSNTLDPFEIQIRFSDKIAEINREDLVLFTHYPYKNKRFFELLTQLLTP
jgi:hypothetical protein